MIRYYEKDDCMVAIEEDEGVILSVARLRTSSEDVVVEIGDDGVEFLSDEFEIDMQETRTLKCDLETANHIIRMCLEIEAEEVLKADGEVFSRRGEMASHIINLLHGP